jgi:hypothetical protein
MSPTTKNNESGSPEEPYGNFSSPEIEVDYDSEEDLSDPNKQLEEGEEVEEGPKKPISRNKGDISPAKSDAGGSSAAKSATTSSRKLSVAEYKTAHPGKSTFPAVEPKVPASSSEELKTNKDDPRDLVSYEDTTDPSFAYSASTYDSDVESRRSRTDSVHREHGIRRSQQILRLYDTTTVEFHEGHTPSDVWNLFFLWLELRRKKLAPMTPEGADKSWTAFVKFYNYGRDFFDERMDKLSHDAVKYGRPVAPRTRHEEKGYVPWTLETLPRPLGSLGSSECSGPRKRKAVRSPPRESTGDSSFEVGYQPGYEDSTEIVEPDQGRQNVRRPKAPKSESHNPATSQEVAFSHGASGTSVTSQQSTVPHPRSQLEERLQKMERAVQKHYEWVTQNWKNVSQLLKDRDALQKRSDDQQKVLDEHRVQIQDLQNKNLQLHQKIWS